MVTAIQPIIASDGKVQTAIMTESDYKIPGVAFKSGTYSGGVSDWDTASWDTATWSSGNYISKDWISTGQYGYNFITRIRIRSAFQKVKWYSINYLFNPAGLV